MLGAFVEQRVANLRGAGGWQRLLLRLLVTFLLASFGGAVGRRPGERRLPAPAPGCRSRPLSILRG
jgi:hypothetical protein